VGSSKLKNVFQTVKKNQKFQILATMHFRVTTIFTMELNYPPIIPKTLSDDKKRENRVGKTGTCGSPQVADLGQILILF